MSRPPKLTDTQKLRLSKLDPQLKNAVQSHNFELAKSILIDLQQVLKPTGHINRLIQYKNWVFELAIEMGMYDYAERGFIGNRKLVNKNTRVYLEATALLAICYLRKNEYEKAKPYIKDVLQNEIVIRSSNTRRIFHSEIIARFDEEVALFSLKSLGNEPLDVNEIQDEAGKLLSTNNEDELYVILGKALPPQTKILLFQIDEFAKKQLPSAERKLLAPPINMTKDDVAGKTFFKSLKHVFYNSICDSKSEVYQAWCKNGLGIVLDKKFLTSAILCILGGLGIGYKALAVSTIALILRFGLDVYCEHYKPTGIMEIREK